jgi:hypothetical protein
VPGVGILSLGDGSLANWASVLLREPLLDAVHMVAMATFQPAHLFVRFKFFLQNNCIRLVLMHKSGSSITRSHGIMELRRREE